MDTIIENRQAICKHDFVQDLIDIDPDRSKIVYTCDYCGFMTSKLPETIIQPKPVKIQYRDFIYESDFGDYDYMIGDTPIPCTYDILQERFESKLPESNPKQCNSNKSEIKISTNTNKQNENIRLPDKTQIIKPISRRWRDIICDYIYRFTNILRTVSNSPKTTRITSPSSSPVHIPVYSKSSQNNFENNIERITPKLFTPSPEIDLLSSASGYSSISYESLLKHDEDLHSIHVEHDIEELSSIAFEDTESFVPKIKYGKVIKVLSPRDIIIACRIYNGYTKVLKPKLYRFNITLSGIPYYGSNEELIHNKLTTMILDKIVVIENIYIHPESNLLYADIYLSKLNINSILLTF